MIDNLDNSEFKEFRWYKNCRFCVKKEERINYKEADNLKKFLSEHGKITPRRISGNCAKHQRVLSVAIKRARILALLPFVVEDA